MIFASPDHNSVKNYAYVLRASCLKNNISFKMLLGIIKWLCAWINLFPLVCPADRTMANR